MSQESGRKRPSASPVWQGRPLLVLGRKSGKKRPLAKKTLYRRLYPRHGSRAGIPWETFKRLFAKNKTQGTFSADTVLKLPLTPYLGQWAGKRTNRKSLFRIVILEKSLESPGKSLFESLQKVSKSSGLSKSRLRSVHNGIKWVRLPKFSNPGHNLSFSGRRLPEHSLVFQILNPTLMSVQF